MPIKYRRQADVEERRVGKHLFLVALGRGEIHHMNEMGAGIWRLLATPHSAKELIEILAAAFPAADAKAIARDIRQLVRTLESAGLVTRTSKRKSADCVTPTAMKSCANS